MSKPALSPARRRAFIVVLGLFGVALACGVVAALRLSGAVAPPTPHDLMEQQVQRVLATPDRPSALIVGDSFLEVHWPFKRVLGRDLPAYLERRGVSAVLSAMAGVGPQGYLNNILEVLARTKPKLVVLFFFAGNDVTDTMRAIGRRPARPGSCRCDRASARRLVFDWEMMRRCGVAPDVVEAAKRRVREPHAPGGDRVNPHLICAGLEYPALYRANLALKGPDAAAAWEKIEALLRQIREEVAHFGELRIVAIPAALQVDPAYGSFLRKMGFDVDDALSAARAPQRRLKAFCQREKIPFLDLLPACLAAPARKELYFQLDDHFSGAGHELAYRAVLEQILDPWLAAQGK